MTDKELLKQVTRIAAAIERLSPEPIHLTDFTSADAFVWRLKPDTLHSVEKVNRVGLDLLLGIDRTKETLYQNTLNFARGYSANNALLWGARGMGKSSLIKAVHRKISCTDSNLKIIEIHREDLSSLDRLLDILRVAKERFILFCDDLSFSMEENNYKTLKAALDGGVEGRPTNVIFYVTSNRRHLMPRDMIENERSTAINPSESVDEKVSLSDRFGLWLGFHPCSQDLYLEIIRKYCLYYGLDATEQMLTSDAIEWQQTRGARSGRVAWQYILYLAGKLHRNIGA
ncbi:MAG: ATP-binding protein [Rhodobacteraceae bacterium]|nr:ATP-binding protein [Paracoccaceae bacterium]MCY4250909.1 ATP-binding protein [Paracoccaceae bacterium]